jgi:hypothetical protein
MVAGINQNNQIMMVNRSKPKVLYESLNDD